MNSAVANVTAFYIADVFKLITVMLVCISVV